MKMLCFVLMLVLPASAWSADCDHLTCFMQGQEIDVVTQAAQDQDIVAEHGRYVSADEHGLVFLSILTSGEIGNHWYYRWEQVLLLSCTTCQK